MKERKFVGSGWETKYGISISIKRDELMGLDVDNWGQVRLYVGRMKGPDGKSKATHYVAVEEKREATSTPPEVKKDLPF